MQWRPYGRVDAPEPADERDLTEKMYRGLASADTMMASAGGVILDRRATAPQNQTINLTGGGLVSEVERQLPPARYRSRSAKEFRGRLFIPLLGA